MSLERLDRGQQFALLAVLAGLLAPHLLRLPLWLIGTLALLFVWRGWLTRIQGRMPPKWLLLPITFALIIGVFFEYRTLLGRTGGVALLAALVGAKLLETRARRDALILVYLGYFLVLTNFLFDQSMTMAVYLGLMVLLVTTLLMGWHSKGGWTGRWPVAWAQLRFAGVMFLQALPLMALLFVFFPRIEGPLWRLPQDRGQARSGLADSMSPGSFSDMSRDDEVAFRVSFESSRPAQSQLYWRGPIFDDYDGRTWTQTPDLSPAEPPKPDPASEVRYAMMLEPHQRPWLLALDMPVAAPAGARFSSQYQLVSPRNLDKRRRIELTSVLDYRVGVAESAVQLERALRLPAGFNPRATALAQGWMALPPQERINAALRLFGSQSLSYTLQPPLYGRDAVDQFVFEGKQGFCEHFAGAFVFMMRAAGVPARVVGGYQGGEDNAGYLIVRQADAHAWAEVWLEGEGWRRVDPTFEVAPARIEQGLASAVDEAELPYLLRLDNNLVKRARLLLDSAVNNWNLWVVGYTPERQREVLRKLGIDSLASGGFVAWFLGSTGMLIALLAAWLLWRMRPPRVDPARRLWDRYCRQFVRRGLAPLPAEGPADFTGRLQAAFPAQHAALAQALDAYLATRYGGTASVQALAQQLRAVRIP